MTSPTGSPIADKVVLGISTNGARGSLSLDGAQVVWEKKAMHSELATMKLQELLAQTGRTLQDLTHIAVVVGPGSFTGIRVGVNLARSLAYGLAIPVASFNTLAVLAARYLVDGERGLIATKAVQSFYYGAVYLRQADGLLEITPPTSFEKKQLQDLKPTCNKTLIEGESPDFSTETEARELIEWLQRWPKSRHYFPWKDLKPLYVRASEPEEKMRKGLLKPLT